MRLRRLHNLGRLRSPCALRLFSNLLGLRGKDWLWLELELVVACSSSSVRQQELTLPSKPRLGILAVLLHNLRAEVQKQFVILPIGWSRLLEEIHRPSIDMIINDSANVNRIILRK